MGGGARSQRRRGNAGGRGAISARKEIARLCQQHHAALAERRRGGATHQRTRRRRHHRGQLPSANRCGRRRGFAAAGRSTCLRRPHASPPAPSRAHRRRRSRRCQGACQAHAVAVPRHRGCGAVGSGRHRRRDGRQPNVNFCIVRKVCSFSLCITTKGDLKRNDYKNSSANTARSGILSSSQPAIVTTWSRGACQGQIRGDGNVSEAVKTPRCAGNRLDSTTDATPKARWGHELDTGQRACYARIRSTSGWR